jgi:hypothetical protein
MTSRNLSANATTPHADRAGGQNVRLETLIRLRMLAGYRVGEILEATLGRCVPVSSMIAMRLNPERTRVQLAIAVACVFAFQSRCSSC